MIMRTVKAKELKGGMVIELPDIAPGFKPGLVSNTCFNWLACLVTTETMAQGFNTMIDVLQLTFYTLIKLNRFNRLDRYDLPFLVAGLLAIAL